MNKFKLYTLLSLSIMISGCTSDDDNLGMFDMDNLVHFNITLNGEPSSKASIVTTENQSETFKKFGVYSLNLVGGDYFMDNERINYNSNTSSWESVNPVADWPSGGVRFYGYAPYMNPNVVTSIDGEGDMVINFKNEDLADDQVDLMVTDPVALSSEACVNMKFNHALAAIAFKFSGDGSAKIRSIGFKGVYGSGSLTASSNGKRSWSNCLFDEDKVYRMVPSSNNNTPREDEPVITSVDGDYLMMIPIEKEKFADMDIVVSLESTQGDTQNIVAFDMPVDLDWEAGNIYTYTMDILNMDVINFDVVVNPWVEHITDYDTSIEPELGALEISNCYMYNSNLTDRVVYIPVDERLEDFYKGYLGYSGDLLKSYTLQVQDTFKPTVIWYVGDDSFEACIDDFVFEQVPLSEMETIERNDRVMPTCTNNFLTSSCRAAMKITIPEAAKEGSILIGLTKEIDSVETLLWSWHLWVTEYDPNSVEPVSSGVEGIYNVIKGEVHRYKDSGSQTPAVWGAGGIYADSYIMDRNIGARDINRKYGENDVFWYQFGRKDPMPAEGDNTTYSEGYAYEESNMYGGYNRGSAMGMLASVRNPTIQWFVTSGTINGVPSWTEDTAAFDENATWNDVGARHDLYANKYTVQKSIFDPSPLGWKIPVYAVWSDLLDLKDVYKITEENKGVTTPDNYNFSFNLWPLNGNTDGMLFSLWDNIHFTDTGYLAWNEAQSGHDSGSSISTYYGFVTSLWSCTNGKNYTNSNSQAAAADQDRPVPSRGYYFRVGAGNGTSSLNSVSYGSTPRNASMSIRCIQEQY